MFLYLSEFLFVRLSVSIIANYFAPSDSLSLFFFFLFFFSFFFFLSFINFCYICLVTTATLPTAQEQFPKKKELNWAAIRPSNTPYWDIGSYDLHTVLHSFRLGFCEINLANRLDHEKKVKLMIKMGFLTKMLS